ncbi:hypothetical protein BYT27DRAFT_7222240 [Phlegmacium glaucopus]|nr:hypothetical protein BYT27DRAFT_7222240 [Phlegmacium glaucopus]
MCEKLVEDTVQKKYTEDKFVEELRKTGVSIHEADDYIQSLKQCIELQHSASQPQESNTLSSTSLIHPENDPADPIRAVTPEGLDDDQTASFRARRAQELERVSVPSQPLSSTDIDNEVAWAILRSKLKHTSEPNDTTHPFESVSDLLKNLPPPDASSSIPSSTWKLRQAYCSKKAIDPIIDLMQCQHLSDPIPRSIWRKIIQDEFVDFEHLYGSTDRSYNHQDDQKEFAGGYVLTKKEQVPAKKPIRSEAEWVPAVLHLFPHRCNELQNYRTIVVDFFRATPHNTSIAIQFDIEARDRYAHSPYHLDSRDMLHIPLLVQLFRGSNSGSKRDSDSTYSSSSKRAMRSCRIKDEKEKNLVSQQAETAIGVPRSFVTSSKRKAEDLIYNPHFRRCYMWTDSSNSCSPAVMNTETAEPLQSPPEHILNNPKIHSMLSQLQDYKGKPRVITDHAGSGLNDGIPKEESRVQYDDMHSFGQVLREARRNNPAVDLILYKSDVASAFLNLSAHPIWQLQQVVTIDNKKYIVQLLLLWERILCPFEDKKQEHSNPLKIIGLWVDVNLGTISLSPDSVNKIITKINNFLSVPSRQQPLREWQRLSGHLNWLLNVLPWGRPALSELYPDTIPKAIRFLDKGHWPDYDADVTVWTDANLKDGLGFPTPITVSFTSLNHLLLTSKSTSSFLNSSPSYPLSITSHL